jgi:hypothetical protein
VTQLADDSDGAAVPSPAGTAARLLGCCRLLRKTRHTTHSPSASAKLQLCTTFLTVSIGTLASHKNEKQSMHILPSNSDGCDSEQTAHDFKSAIRETLA